jgi:5-methylcytosine-specific restriction endonuclease McrA
MAYRRMKSELDHYLQIEQLMPLAKGRAHHYLANGWMDQCRTASDDRGPGNLLCEYCLIAEADTFYGCQVDHIISLKHGGSSEVDNLAYACGPRNRAKGSDVGSISTTGEFTRFLIDGRTTGPSTFAWKAPQSTP